MNSRMFAFLPFVFLGIIFNIAGCSPKEQATTASAEAPMKINGEAFYRERMAVPPEVQFEVLLEDISLADAPATIIGSQQIPNAGQPPYQFSIDYLPSAIIAGHRYSLRARLTLNGELLFTTDQINPVFAEGQENQTQLLMRRAASPTAEAATSELTNTYWKLITLNGKEVAINENQREPHLVFNDDMRVHGSDGCNNIGGGYTRDDNQLGFTQMISTMMACIDNGAQAQEFTAALETTASYQISDDYLELQDQAGAVIARFNAVALH